MKANKVLGLFPCAVMGDDDVDGWEHPAAHAHWESLACKLREPAPF